MNMITSGHSINSPFFTGWMDIQQNLNKGGIIQKSGIDIGTFYLIKVFCSTVYELKWSSVISSQSVQLFFLHF